MLVDLNIDEDAVDGRKIHFEDAIFVRPGHDRVRQRRLQIRKTQALHLAWIFRPIPWQGAT
jgi:hypothetical protein